MSTSLAASPPVSSAVVVAALRDDAPGQVTGDTPIGVARTLMIALGGSALFGIALGSFSGSAAQMLSSAIKAPMLLMGTTALCFPAFFVMQLTRASKPVSLTRALSIESHALAATALWWGALSLPLLFLVSTVQGYRMAQLLALMVGAVGGAVGLRRFWTGLEARTGPAPRGTMAAYFVLYGVVGAQLSWFLRPFVGSPDQPFTLVRGLESNFFAFLGTLLRG